MQNSPSIVCDKSKYDRDHFYGQEVLCDAYLLQGDFTLNEIADFVRKTRSSHPGTHLLATLDDPAQAAYTSGHSTELNKLDQLDGHDQTKLPDSAYIEVEGEKVFIGYFPFRLSNLIHGAEKYSPINMEDQLLWIGQNNKFSTIRTNASVSSLSRENECLVQIVPVQNPFEALAAFPNGYFDMFLDPFENYALARELFEKFELSLFGVGARYLGFLSENPIDDDRATKISKYLMRCFDGYNGPIPLDDLLHSLIVGKSELYIAYGHPD